jgi:hypothetical protein
MAGAHGTSAMVTVRLVTLLALWMLRRPSPEGEAIRRLSLTSAPGRSPASAAVRRKRHRSEA